MGGGEPNRRKVEVVIIGGSMSGLMLADTLSAGGVEVVVLEARDTYVRDRTWCFWEVRPHPYGSCVRARWNHLEVATKNATRSVSTSYGYVEIDALAFYESTLERLAKRPCADVILGANVLQVHDHKARGTVTFMHNGERLELDALMVFDSRPDLQTERRAHASNEPFLWQHFGGLEVETERPIFDPNRVTLMDFRAAGHGESTHFVYVLPYGPKRALVESTYFGGEPFEGTDRKPASPYRKTVTTYLEDKGAGRWSIEYSEVGRIPMTTVPPERRPSPRHVRIGVSGGAARPATGYAFLNALNDAEEIGKALRSTRRDAWSRLPLLGKRTWATQFLDRTLLAFITERPAEAGQVFVDMFDAHPDRVVRFLSEMGTKRDTLAVMARCPPMRFARSSVLAHLRKLG